MEKYNIPAWTQIPMKNEAKAMVELLVLTKITIVYVEIAQINAIATNIDNPFNEYSRIVRPMPSPF